ncbi:MAG: ABC transporter permease [Lachnospiraceae bacterium]|nr:ABC transporter permease [Lachnospiraceae bacterium]
MNGKDEKTTFDFTPVDDSRRDSEQIVRPSVRYWPEVWKRLLRNRLADVCIVIILIMILLAIFAPILSPYSYTATDLLHTNLKPSLEHLFGTDVTGRDMWTRVWVGARASLVIGFLGALAPFILGTVIGAIAGWCGGWVDMAIMRICDIMLCIPSLIYLILLIIVMGGSVRSLIIAMALSGWMGSARSFRGRVLQFKNREFTLAAKVQGAGAGRIIFRHILPNILGNIVVGLSSSIPGAIFTEAGMAYIGLGVTPPGVSLGQLSTDGVSYFLIPSKFHLFLWPSVVITVMIFAFFMLGNCIRDALDPRLRDEEYNARRLRKLKRMKAHA